MAVIISLLFLAFHRATLVEVAPIFIHKSHKQYVPVYDKVARLKK